jgi:HEAT repeat protein
LRYALADESDGVRREAATSLVRLKKAMAAPLIAPLLDDADASVREHVAGLLADMRHKSVAPLLIAAMAHTDPHVRSEAVRGGFLPLAFVEAGVTRACEDPEVKTHGRDHAGAPAART